MLYSLVARRDVVLCDYALHKGNFDSVALSFLSKVPQCSMLTYFAVDDQNMYMVHVLVENSFIYLCITDVSFSNEKAYQFLLKIKQDFTRFYQRALNASAFELRKEFSIVLKVKTTYFSNIQLKDKVMKVEGIVKVNIEDGNHLQSSQERSNQFNNTGSRLHQKIWWENTKMWLMLVTVLIVIAIIISMLLWVT